MRIAVVRPEGRSLDDWLKAVPPGAIQVFACEEGELEGGLEAQRNLRQSKPDVVVVEGSTPDRLLRLLSRVHTLVPGAWIFAVSESQQPELIIKCVRAGAREFLARPVTPEALAAAFDRYYQEHPDELNEPGLVYAVTSAKGGCGSTSVAINLAAAIARLPETRVALADLTLPVGDVATYLGVKPKYTLSDALAAAHRLDPVLLETFMTVKGKTHILAGQPDFGEQPELPAENLTRLLAVLERTFTHTVLDLSGTVSEGFLGAVAGRSSAILVVLTSEIPAIWRTHRLLEFLDRRGDGEKARVVLNRSQKQGDITVKEIEKTLNRALYWELPNNYRTTMDSINRGLPVVEVNHSNLARSYEDLAQRLTGLRREERKKGLLSLFS